MKHHGSLPSSDGRECVTGHDGLRRRVRTELTYFDKFSFARFENFVRPIRSLPISGSDALSSVSPQEQVADAAGTSHTAISRLENGTHTPQLTTLRRIAAVLDEELLLCFQRVEDGELEREFAAVRA